MRTSSPTDRASNGYKTVVFDLGNVLVGWDPYSAVSKYLTPEEWETFVKEAQFGELNQRADAGEALDDLAAELSVHSLGHAVTLARYFENFAVALTGPVPGSAEIVQELSRAGYLLLGLTNWADATFEHAALSAPIVNELEDVIVSGRLGITKPDPAIFEHLLNRHGLDPSETIFVDDSRANVEAAQKLGMHAILFEDAGTLRVELQKLGVLD